MGKNKKSALILLSGGLDSVVSIPFSNCDIKLGLIFDYGQMSFQKEKEASLKIADFYKFELKEIKLDWLKEILSNGLTSSDMIVKPNNIDDKSQLEESMKSVWVPNRNSLFINIAASFCEALNIQTVIIGANKEEGAVFKDNSKEFIENCNELLKTSTNSAVEVFAPLIDMDKKEIIATALKYNVPLEFIYSCYLGTQKHCGVCESCLHLKNALVENNKEDLIKKLF